MNLTSTHALGSKKWGGGFQTMPCNACLCPHRQWNAMHRLQRGSFAGERGKQKSPRVWPSVRMNLTSTHASLSIHSKHLNGLNASHESNNPCNSPNPFTSLNAFNWMESNRLNELDEFEAQPPNAIYQFSQCEQPIHAI